MLSSLNDAKTNSLYENTMQIITTYFKHNFGRVTYDSSSDDDQVRRDTWSSNSCGFILYYIKSLPLLSGPPARGYAYTVHPVLLACSGLSILKSRLFL